MLEVQQVPQQQRAGHLELDCTRQTWRSISATLHGQNNSTCTATIRVVAMKAFLAPTFWLAG